jgi:hypothetical protein
LKNEKDNNNSIAVKYTFLEILYSTNKSDSNIYEFKQNCLIPGLYYEFLMKWLNYFPKNSVFIIDFDSFKTQTSYYMERLQIFLEFKNIEFKNILDYELDNSVVKSKQSNSLEESSKFDFRKLKIDDECRAFLKNYYEESNNDLKRVLIEYNYDVPKWL